MSAKILFSDKLHFHERNFKSLIKLVSKDEKFDVEYNTNHHDWMALYGDYSSKFSCLQSYYSLLSSLSQQELRAYQVRSVNVYDLAKAELLTYLIPVKEMYLLDISDDDQQVYDYVFQNYKHELCSNMAAALFWLDFWYEKVIINKKKYTHVFTFSGSNIYTKALIKTCQNTPSRCFVMETSLTGNDFYIEEKLSHIANNSDIKQIAIRKKHLASLEAEEKPYNTRVKAINKLNLIKNKNVTQPYSEYSDLEFSHEADMVAIFGQVVNDYSVIETQIGKLSTVSIYKDLISQIVQNTQLNIVFKAHPWEEKKTNCESDMTYQALTQFVKETLTPEQQGRVRIVKDFDIDVIFSHAKHAITINSQSGLEAAAHGIKPIVLGNPFYGRFGFTHDCSIKDNLAEVLKNNSGSLTLDEFDRYETFLTIYLEKHLYSVNPSGEGKIRREIFSSYTKIPLVEKKKQVKPVASGQDKNGQRSTAELTIGGEKKKRLNEALLVQK